MLPLSDRNPSRTTPVVNYLLIAANVLVFLWELSLGPDIERDLFIVSFVPARFWVAPFYPVNLIRILMSMFLHGGWLHLGGNMLFLWIFGDNIEDRLGHLTYLAFYLICGIVANLAQVEVDPTSVVPAVGASGAIAGVLGAYAVTFPGAQIRVLVPILFFFVLEVPAFLMIGIWFVTQFFSGVAALTAASMQSAGIAWWAHVGGFVCGIVLMVILPQNPSPSQKTWTSLQERARADTGVVGL